MAYKILPPVVFVAFIIMLSFFAQSPAARDLYPYKFTELQIMDYDEMSRMVDKKITEAKSISIKMQKQGLEEEGDKAAIEKLREALQVLLSRPDKDNMVAKLFPNLRRELLNYAAFEETLASVSFQAVFAIKNDKLSMVQRSTAVFVLENMMAEVRPMAAENVKIREILKKVRDAKIKIPEKVKSHRKLTSMDGTPDISKAAGLILDQTQKQFDERQKAATQPDTVESE